MKKLFRLLPLVCLALLLTACTKSNADKITSVLNQCAKTSHTAGSVSRDPAAQAQFVADEFQKMDVRSCPADFRVAFQRHVFAWQQAVPYLQQDNVGTTILEGLAAGLAEDPRYLGAASGQAAGAVQEINASYLDLTVIAAAYGASIPSSVVGR